MVLTEEITDTLQVSSGASVSPGNKNEKVEKNRGSFGQFLHVFISFYSHNVISRKSKMNGPYDVIIVPGIPYDEQKGAGMIMKARIVWANYLISEGIARNVIFSGSAVHTPYIESRIMAMYALQLGIPANHIFCETRAEHGTENIIYSCRMAKTMGFKKIALATGPFQSSFLSAYVKDHSLQISFLPMTFVAMTNIDNTAFPRIDDYDAFVSDFVSLKDRETKRERMHGTLGNKIERSGIEY